MLGGWFNAANLHEDFMEQRSRYHKPPPSEMSHNAHHEPLWLRPLLTSLGACSVTTLVLVCAATRDFYVVLDRF
jgi:hypothetical protein